MKFIRSVPMAMGGLSLGFAALGNLLLPLPHGVLLRYICGILSLTILLIFALKIVLDFPHAREELKIPIPLSVLPTATMTLMLLSTYLLPFIEALAISIWYIAVITHLFIMALFFLRFIRGFKLNTVFPSWFVTFVGIVVASVTAPATGNILIGQIAFYLGFVLYFTALTLVIRRMIKVKIFPEPARPTIAIFTAPMSLLIVGYLNSFVQQGQLNETLVYVMLAIAVISYIYVTIKMFSLLRIKFYPTYAAFTFPYVISATAFRFGAAFLAERGFNFFTPIAQISLWVAVVVVLYVFLYYIRFFRWWNRF